MANSPFEFERMTAWKPAAPVMTIDAPAIGWPSEVAKSPLDSAGGQLREQRSRNENQSRQQRPEPDCRETTAIGGAR